ncbi:MAG: hypothetical protein WCW26_02120 [Candidatus Buchananbacteria bacterium]
MAKAIQNKEELIETVKYIATETSKLAEKIIGKTFPITSLTVFSHSQPEYEVLIKILESLGKSSNYNNGPRVELNDPILVGENKITHLRIRKPDLERPQVGCNDFVTDYQVFKEKYLSKFPKNLSLIKRPEYEMIEFHEKNFDVLAYIVSTLI